MRPTVHMKGFILQLLETAGASWDYEVADQTMSAYELSGEYWYGTVRLTLTDLYSGGLVREVESDVDPAKSFGVERLLIKFELTPFGRQRMLDTGLLEDA